MLGREFTRHFRGRKSWRVIALDKKQADITDLAQVEKMVRKYRPDFAANCAGLINVEYAEKNPLFAWQVNAIGPGNIANALGKIKSRATFLQISTSDVFGNTNKKSFSKDDAPLPVNVYGWSKLGGEKIIEAEAKASGLRYFIARTSWLYSEFRGTFVDLVVKTLREEKELLVIADQYNTITWTRDLVKGCESLLVNQKLKSGIYHLTNKAEKKLSKYDIALKIAEILNLEKKYLKKGYKSDILTCVRPNQPILTNNKFISLPKWEKSLAEYLRIKYGK